MVSICSKDLSNEYNIINMRIYIHNPQTYTYILTHIHTYIHTYTHTYRHADIHTYIHTYIHKYRHADIHTYEHTDGGGYVHKHSRTHAGKQTDTEEAKEGKEAGGRRGA